jgi:hypothetical protein
VISISVPYSFNGPVQLVKLGKLQIETKDPKLSDLLNILRENRTGITYYIGDLVPGRKADSGDHQLSSITLEWAGPDPSPWTKCIIDGLDAADPTAVINPAGQPPLP